MKRFDPRLLYYLSVAAFLVSLLLLATIVLVNARRLSDPFEQSVAHGQTAPVIRASIVQEASLNQARPHVLTTEQLADVLGCNADTVRRRQREGRLVGYHKLARDAWAPVEID